MDKPNPGSREAQALGCCCPVIDNHHGAGMPYPDGPRFWINGDCILHSPIAKSANTSDAEGMKDVV